MSQAHDMLKQCSLSRIGTFQHSVLSNIPYLSLPAAFADELCPGLAPVQAVLPKILFLGTLFLFPAKKYKRVDHNTTFNHVYFESPLRLHSSFFHAVVHIKKAAWKYVSSTQMLYLNYHIWAAFINLPASCKPVQIDLYIPSLSMGQKEVFVAAFLNGKPASIHDVQIRSSQNIW